MYSRHYRATNEPVLSYMPGSSERATLKQALGSQRLSTVDIPLVIDGQRIQTKKRAALHAPHDRRLALASVSVAGEKEARQAIAAAIGAQPAWSRWKFADRAAIFLKAADLLSGPWRQRLNAATMLGQSKTVHQAEIDSACELIDFLRFNVQFAAEIAEQQPLSTGGVRNSLEYRPLEGFVYAVTPFNFTAIGGNLPTAPALMGNTVIWKPAGTAALSNYLFMELLEEAGLPPGVINFLPGEPAEISEVLLKDPHLGGVHFTGSTGVFDTIWQRVAQNLSRYRSYPRLVGETGGKDFVLAHASADVDALAVALLRGAFEYQGQKCSAASRAYVPSSLWPTLRERLLEDVMELSVGDVADFENFMGAVIDRRAYERICGALSDVANDSAARLLTPGPVTSEQGYFVPPSLVEVSDPYHRLMREELFGPVLSILVYPETRWGETLKLVDGTGAYGLTGAVFGQDRRAVAEATDALRDCAGNFYINDKPTGAVVGQQPFGGGRRSGTNDKAGSPLNLLRWTSPRTIKETYVPPLTHAYPSMRQEERGE